MFLLAIKDETEASRVGGCHLDTQVRVCEEKVRLHAVNFPH